MPGSDQGAPAAACRDVVQVYGSASGQVHVLRGVSLDVPAGSITAVVGPSGAGKSSLLRLLACLERPTVGDVFLAGQPTTPLSDRALRRLAARHVGYVFQNPSENLLEYLDVEAHVRLAWRMRAPEAVGDVDRLLDAMDLRHLAGARPADLLVGEQQRVAVAMAVAAGPALVVADEPTASLDPAGAAGLTALLPGLAAGGRTFVIATHDPGVIAVADQVLVLHRGALASERLRGADFLAVIDDAGRLVLPQEATTRLRGRRARVTIDGERLWIGPP